MRKLLTAVLVVSLCGWVALAGTVQINVLFGWPDSIDGTQPCWMQHGMGQIPRDLVKELGYKSPRELALNTVTVTLYVDGVEIPSTGLKTPAVAPKTDGIQRFNILYFWRFPAKFFEPGLREFTVHWVSTMNGPVDLWRTHIVDVQY